MAFVALQIRVTAAATVIDSDRDVTATVGRDPVAERHRGVARPLGVVPPARGVCQRRGHQCDTGTGHEGPEKKQEVTMHRRKTHSGASLPTVATRSALAAAARCNFSKSLVHELRERAGTRLRRRLTSRHQTGRIRQYTVIAVLDRRLQCCFRSRLAFKH